MSAPEHMTLRKFRCRTFGGGIGAQFDWLAINLTGGFHEQACAGTPARDGQQTVSLPVCRDASEAKPEPMR